MTEETLAPLLVRVADGETEAMQTLFGVMRRPLHGFFFRLCRDSGVADDLLQNTFLSLWRYRGARIKRGKAVAYVFRVALNEWHQFRSRRARFQEIREDLARYYRERGPSEVDVLDREEQRRLLWESIESLPPLQKEALVLHRFEGLSCREIADTTGDPLKTIESRLRLALHKMSEKMRVRKELE